MNRKHELEMKIKEKELQLFRAERESGAWNKDKHKNTSNAKISKIYVDSLREEINSLMAQLENM